MPNHALAIVIFLAFTGFTLALSFWLGRKAKSSAGYFAAHGQIGWFVNGIAFAGDYLSAASFLGICGMIAFYGYDGFLYSIGFLAGWVVALFVIAEPIKRLGKYTFADALNAKFQSPGITLAAAISTLVVSVFYLIPQMVGAGALIQPLLGWPHWAGVVVVGTLVIFIVTTAGMVSTTWVQFIKGSLLVVFCFGLVVMILKRGVQLTPPKADDVIFGNAPWVTNPNDYSIAALPGAPTVMSITDKRTSETSYWSYDVLVDMREGGPVIPEHRAIRNSTTQPKSGIVVAINDVSLADRPLSPVDFIDAVRQSQITKWKARPIVVGGAALTVYGPETTPAEYWMVPGGSPTFKGIRSAKLTDRLDFVSLMLALFCGTASLPHILIRYYTVKDAAAARKSTVVGIGAIGFFYILTLYIGLGAMVSGAMPADPKEQNMAAPLLARTFGEWPFALISAIAFTTVLGTVSGLILAAAGAVAHDLRKLWIERSTPNVQRSTFKEDEDRSQVRVAKLASVVVGLIAIGLGILAKDFSVAFLVGWAFNVAASANLPALVMLLFWRGTTRQGIIASISVGLVTSLGWLLLSGPAYSSLYGADPARALAPFSQPGLVTIPLSFAVLVLVSLATRRDERRGFEVA